MEARRERRVTMRVMMLERGENEVGVVVEGEREERVREERRERKEEEAEEREWEREGWVGLGCCWAPGIVGGSRRGQFSIGAYIETS